MRPISFKRHRFPPDGCCQAVWLYFRFTLGLRDVKELLTARGVDVTYETNKLRLLGGAVSPIATRLRLAQLGPKASTSGGARLPLGQRGRAADLVSLPIDEIGREIETVV